MCLGWGMDNLPLSEAKISIVGLGLMGGSLAMALGGKCQELYGVDTNPDVISFAAQNGIVDLAVTKLEDTLSNSNVIVLAAPVGTILQIIHDLPDLHSGSAIVMDIGSTKREIVAAFEGLPNRFDPIGGHPICGKEDLSISNADPEIFQGASFAFTPLERTTKKARDFSWELAKSIGAQPFWIDAPTHDAWSAASSHLPYLISLSLALSTPHEVNPLVGSGFKSVVRLAGTPGSMMVDILRTNRDEILTACARFSDQLEMALEFLETSDYDKLAELITLGRSNRNELLKAGKR
ncbi:MAG: prephenate dehydrogenase [Chloroflexi bacterium]|nr:prephenate dehydrogenase [Chloroflexota bacterium]